jgi:hypothetical protein
MNTAVVDRVFWNTLYTGRVGDVNVFVRSQWIDLRQ